MEHILFTLKFLFQARPFKIFRHIKYTDQEELVCSVLLPLQVCFIVEVTEGKERGD